jgi:opacity protein-like surface antigen
MKKLCVAFSAVVILAYAGSAFAQSTYFDVKGGGAYAKDPKKLGFNANVSLGTDLNPYFMIFAKPGFSWFKWDQGLGIYQTVGPVTSELKSSVNAYAFPVLGGAKVKFVDMKESMGIVPYISAAVGYTWMKYDYEVPAYSTYAAEKVSNTFKGLTWEVLAGLDYQFEGTNMSMGVEAGYRGMKLKKGNYEVDMSGFLANVGVSFALDDSQGG